MWCMTRYSVNDSWWFSSSDSYHLQKILKAVNNDTICYWKHKQLYWPVWWRQVFSPSQSLQQPLRPALAEKTRVTVAAPWWAQWTWLPGDPSEFSCLMGGQQNSQSLQGSCHQAGENNIEAGSIFFSLYHYYHNPRKEQAKIWKDMLKNMYNCRMEIVIICIL